MTPRTEADGVWVRAAGLSDLRPGRPVKVQRGDVHVALFKIEGGDGGLYAVEDVCTHDDGPLAEGVVEGREIRCPRHGARFDLRSGDALSMPAVTPIRTFPVKTEGEDVLIRFPE